MMHVLYYRVDVPLFKTHTVLNVEYVNRMIMQWLFICLDMPSNTYF